MQTIQELRNGLATHIAYMQGVAARNPNVPCISNELFMAQVLQAGLAVYDRGGESITVDEITLAASVYMERHGADWIDP
jgi:hypothetical protein